MVTPSIAGSAAAISVMNTTNIARTRREDEEQQASQLSQGCKYSVKITSGEFQCMTQVEYDTYKSSENFTYHQVATYALFTIIAVLVVLVGAMIITVIKDNF
jgi:hypothetical protein